MRCPSGPRACRSASSATLRCSRLACARLNEGRSQALYGAKRVLLLTDSASVLLQLQRLPHARAFDWQWLDLDRARISGDGRQNLHVPPGRRVYIEHRAEAGDVANAMREVQPTLQPR